MRCSDNSYKMYFTLGIDLPKFAFQKLTANSEYISLLKKCIFTLGSLIPNFSSDMSAQVPATPYFNVYYFFFYFILTHSDFYIYFYTGCFVYFHVYPRNMLKYFKRQKHILTLALPILEYNIYMTMYFDSVCSAVR